MSELYSVAIDGPSGAGKSTLAKAAAAALGICYVDTGAIYRTIGYGVYCRGIDPSGMYPIPDAAAVAAVLPEMRLELHYDQAGLQRMKLAGRDVTEEIRLPEMSKYASKVSAIPAVRDFLPPPQRDYGRPGHRHGGAAGRYGEDLPHRCAGGAGHAPVPGAGAARHAPAL